MHYFSVFVAGRYSQPYLHRGLTGFLSFISLLGLSLAVFTLIVVMSVMNGFEKELQSRMLALVPHIQIPIDQTVDVEANDLDDLINLLNDQPSVSAAVPYLEETVILGGSDKIFSAQLLGIDSSVEHEVSQLSSKLVAGDLASLAQSKYTIIIGSGLANQLDIFIGDKINITLPRVFVTPLGPTLRQKRFTVVGIFEVGSELDLNLVLINRDIAQRLLSRSRAFDGIRLSLINPYQSQAAMQDIQLQITPQYEHFLADDWSDWRDKNRALYSAVVMEKIVIFVLLLSIVAIATFNVISIILMTATNKSGDIAILKTMGATTTQIRQLFIMQGSMVGIAGTLIGAIGGVMVAPKVGVIVSKIEKATGWTLFDPTIYYIPFLPSDLKWLEVTVICVISVTLSVLVTLVPAIRAAKTAPVLSLKEYL